ncbi:hypothetical protein M440DRAFT_1397796 [Trichoderma longibrachiatum ATCC 18648]|uniref:Secreted protein n=1 Tax=Trichoderma longibrachiatum ATCC 18648 TaxID=983965 RepID=A0A2T4CFX8_TRILO|nr:hypothetical protein M440DRAFT_1397796 [Trichoderma longibrachiatum ATCC 18648]
MEGKLLGIGLAFLLLPRCVCDLGMASVWLAGNGMRWKAEKQRCVLYRCTVGTLVKNWWDGDTMLSRAFIRDTV